MVSSLDPRDVDQIGGDVGKGQPGPPEHDDHLVAHLVEVDVRQVAPAPVTVRRQLLRTVGFLCGRVAVVQRCAEQGRTLLACAFALGLGIRAPRLNVVSLALPARPTALASPKKIGMCAAALAGTKASDGQPMWIS
jgi:hypothetical protein